MSEFKSHKDESRGNWGCRNRNPKTEELQLGAMQRIADSLEKIEQPYLRLIERNEYLRRRVAQQAYDIHRLKNQNRGFKSWVTRLSRQLREERNETL